MPAQDARYRSVCLPHAPRLTSGPITPVLETATERPPAPSLPLPALNAVVYDAAERATELLNGVPEPSAGPAGHLARFTASAAGEPYTEQAAHQLGLTYAQMRQLAAAHRYGGSAGVETYLPTTDPGPEIFAQAEDVIQSLRPSPLATIAREGNRLTGPAARIQLRYGPDHRWHPYVEQSGDRRVVPAPDGDPAKAYKAARAALSRRWLPAGPLVGRSEKSQVSRPFGVTAAFCADGRSSTPSPSRRTSGPTADAAAARADGPSASTK